MEICQSCGMPMKMCPEGGGSNSSPSNGGSNAEYCSYCWKDGAFTEDFTDVKKYQSHLYRLMRAKNFLPPVAWFFTLAVPGLGRWKKG